MKITLEQLNHIWTELLQHLHEMGVESIDIEYDYYWDTVGLERFEIYKEAPRLGMGQLTDDWDSLLRVLNEDREPLTEDFVQLAAILRAVGDIGEVALLRQANS
jgi:hypothetical protein